MGLGRVRPLPGFRLTRMRLAFGVLGIVLAFPVQAGACVVHSGPSTAALVELYTAEACSGCPAAERWLSSLGEPGHASQRLVALAVYIEYPYARRDSSLRQRKLTPRQRLALAYTPQVMLQGRDFPGWASPAFGEAVAKISATPARARLSLEIVALRSEALAVRATAEVLDAGEIAHAALYLAAYENLPGSGVISVLEWQRPIAFSRARLVTQRELPLRPKTVAGRSGVVGFVQNRRSADVLQALMLPACEDTFGYIRAE